MVSRLASRRILARAAVLVDQGLSSVSNLLAVVLVARVLTPSDFGRFALGYAVLTLTLGLSRTYFGSRISLAPTQQAARRLTRALVAAMLALSPFVALLVFGVTTVATEGRAPMIAAICALATPVVCVQDAIRFGASAGGRPWAALSSDAVWILAMVLPFLLGIEMSAVTALTLWALAAVAALAVALVAFRERPRLRDGLQELRRRENVGASLTLGAVVSSISGFLVLLVVARTLGPAATGALRGASTAMGPVNVMLAFCGLGLTPLLVRRARSEDRRFCLVLAAVMAGLVLSWGVVLHLLPDGVGAALLGDSWAGVRSILGWTVVEYVFIVASAAATLGLKVRLRAGRLFRLRVVAALATGLLGTLAVTLDDVSDVAAALALSAAVAATASWWSLVRDDRSRDAERAPQAGLVLESSKG